MDGITVPMALTDLIPVSLFLISTVILQHDLYHKMGRGLYSLFSAGTVMVVVADFLKAIWKLLYAANICDFDKLNKLFFPIQALGFLFAGIAVTAMLFTKGEKRGEAVNAEPAAVATIAAATAPALYEGTIIFVLMMCMGIAALCAVLSVAAAKQKKKWLIILFIAAFVLMLGMGYLSSKNFEKPIWNWVAEGVNILGQGALLTGVLFLHFGGLEKMSLALTFADEPAPEAPEQPAFTAALPAEEPENAGKPEIERAAFPGSGKT